MSFTADTSDVQKFARDMLGAEPIIQDETMRAMTRSTTQVEADAKRFVPVDTHHLQRSITHQVQRTGAFIIGRVGSNVPYARVVEEGRGAITIRPRRGRFLRFVIDGREIFARVVHQGPRAAKPYLKKSLQKNQTAINREFEQVIPRVMRRIGR